MVFQWLSLTAALAERKIRAILAKVIADSEIGTKRIPRQVLKEYENSPTFELVSQAFVTQAAYTGYPEVIDWLRKTNLSNDAAQDKAQIALHFTSLMNTSPPLAAHTNLIRNVRGKVEMTSIDLDDPAPIDKFVQTFSEDMEQFMDSVSDLYYTLDFASMDDYNQRHTHYSCWHSSTSPPRYYTHKGDNADIEEHKRELNLLILHLQDKNVPDSVVIHVLSSTLGNAGMKRLDRVLFPAFVSFLPHFWLKQHRDDIWEKRKEGDEDSDGDIPPPSDVQSDLRDRVDEDIRAALRTMNFGDIVDIVDELSTPDVPYRQGDVPEEAEEPEAPAGQPQGPPPPPPPPQQNQAGLPDDDDYEPDSFLARRVRDLTKHFQDLDEMDMTRDHLERFEVNDYSPVPLMKRQIRRTDSIVFRGQSTVSQKYVVTFTRQHRKPIFNPVN